MKKFLLAFQYGLNEVDRIEIFEQRRVSKSELANIVMRELDSIDHVKPLNTAF